jgi:hypothetical protein
LSEREIICGFWEFLEEKKIPDKLFPLKCALDSIATSSSECEWGFSQMNLIVTPSRASLLTETTSALSFFKIVGSPVMQFDPTSMLKLGYCVDITQQCTKSKHRNRDIEYPSEDMT